MMQVFRLFEKPVTYTVVVCLAGCLYFYLFVTLLFSPMQFLAGVGVVGNEAAFMLSRRASMLMLGFSVLAFQAAKLQSIVTRQVVAVGIAVNMLGFAVLGCMEYRRGFANAGILRAAVIESSLAALCLLLWFGGRRALTQQQNAGEGMPLAKAHGR